MSTNREQERKELFSSIWKIADSLRGAVDGWDFKNYVLGFMFYRFISENLTNYINATEHDSGRKDFDYAKLTDEEASAIRADMVQEKGFFILPSELFCNVTKKAYDDANLNVTLFTCVLPATASLVNKLDTSCGVKNSPPDLPALEAYILIKNSYASPKASMEFS